MEVWDVIKRTKEARMDLARERPVLGAEKTRIFQDKHKVGNMGHSLQTKILSFQLLLQLQQYIIHLKGLIKE